METETLNIDSLVTKKAPNIVAPAVMANNFIDNDFDLRNYLNKNEFKMAWLLFYPLDFTFVCPTEILAFHDRAAEFKARGVGLLGISVDSQYAHYQYRQLERGKGGIGEISFPLIADIDKKAARDYGVLHNNSVALRGSFLIDENFIIRHQYVNDLPIGRSVDEALRVIDALVHHNKYGEVCPANWNKGEKAMDATPEGVNSYLQAHNKAQ